MQSQLSEQQSWDYIPAYENQLNTPAPGFLTSLQDHTKKFLDPMYTPESLRHLAIDTLRGNDLGGYTIPTHGLYPYQWNWDSAITALGWLTFDEPRAWQEIETLLSGQWHNGMVPQIVFHKPSPDYFPGPERWGAGDIARREGRPDTTCISQPPVLSTCVRLMFERASDRPLAKAKVKAVLPKLIAYHRWWYRERDPEQTGLVLTLHPWETGMDNSPAWDAPLARVPVATKPFTRKDTNHVNAAERPQQSDYARFVGLVDFFRDCNFDHAKMVADCPFKVNDIGIISILHRATADLLTLCEQQAYVTAEVTQLRADHARTAQAIGALWSNTLGQFVSRDAITGELLAVPTSAGLLGLMAGFAAPEQTRALHNTMSQFQPKGDHSVGLCTLRSDHSAYEPKRYWRGPVWLHVNWLISLGLAPGSEAHESLRAQTQALALKQGFKEYYDPRDGSPLGGRAFSWTAAVGLFWLLADGPTGARLRN